VLINVPYDQIGVRRGDRGLRDRVSRRSRAAEEDSSRDEAFHVLIDVVLDDEEKDNASHGRAQTRRVEEIDDQAGAAQADDQAPVARAF